MRIKNQKRQIFLKKQKKWKVIRNFFHNINQVPFFFVTPFYFSNVVNNFVFEFNVSKIWNQENKITFFVGNKSLKNQFKIKTLYPYPEEKTITIKINEMSKKIVIFLKKQKPKSFRFFYLKLFNNLFLIIKTQAISQKFLRNIYFF